MYIMTRLIALATLTVLLINPASAMDDMQKCEGKLKCQASSAVSNQMKQPISSQSGAGAAGRPASHR
jgi:hypothetical protein